MIGKECYCLTLPILQDFSLEESCPKESVQWLALVELLRRNKHQSLLRPYPFLHILVPGIQMFPLPYFLISDQTHPVVFLPAQNLLTWTGKWDSDYNFIISNFKLTRKYSCLTIAIQYQRFIFMVYKNVVGPHVPMNYVVLMQMI